MSKNLYQRMAQVMEEVVSIGKGSEVSTGRGSYKAVSHDDVTALLHKPLIKNGIVAIPSMVSHDLEIGKNSKGNTVYISKAWAEVTFYNVAAPGDSLSVKCFSMGFDSQDKGPGKAYSMAVKYCLLKAFMLESCDEEEQRIRDEEIKIKSDPFIKVKSDYLALLNDFYDLADIPKTEIEKAKKMSMQEMSQEIANLQEELNERNKLNG